ncbi:hypothetical protein [Neobacillus niacini]|uniref:hypothetical protein n=1 Tax=Neobacillus niacini TaxID=86668 RepID=UPI0021CB26F7|nr:hypothetical protein [Neobacillus niacini]MCM3763495.1 hypothetical protein [Neobacillus niacini]
MTFNEVMALIMPSVIALLLYSKVVPENTHFFNGLGFLALCMMITNSICYAVLIYFKKTLLFIFTPAFTLKYSVLATGVAIIVAFVYRFFELNLSINLKVVSIKDEEK